MKNDSDKSNENSDRIVLTPGGPRAKDQVHVVGPGGVVRAAGAMGQARVLEPARGSGLAGTSLNHVLTPGGYRHPSLVHHVGPGQALRAREGRSEIFNLKTKETIALPEADAAVGPIPNLGDGWIAFADWTNTTGNPITSFRTTWTVPPAPATKGGQTIFLFNGIDPANASAGILQPVLQWGTSAAGGGQSWAVASWFVDGSGHAFHTTPVAVNSGDSLVGVMTLDSQAGNAFNYVCEFEGIAGTRLPVQNLPELVWCNETLEAYSLSQCSDYPDTDFTSFRNIEIRTGAGVPQVNWTPVSRVVDCGQHAVVGINSGSGGAVKIYYREPQLIKLPFDRFAEHVKILFGVTNDGGGIIMLNGRIIRVPPWDPENPIFQELGIAVAEAARGFAALEMVSDSGNKEGAKAVKEKALDLSIKGIEGTVKALKKTLSARG